MSNTEILPVKTDNGTVMFDVNNPDIIFYAISGVKNYSGFLRLLLHGYCFPKRHSDLGAKLTAHLNPVS